MTLQFKMNPVFPDHLIKENLHVISSKKTLFAIHHPIQMERDLDSACTRTNLISFRRKDDAKYFQDMLTQYQTEHKILPDRVFDGSSPEYRLKHGSNMGMDIITMEADVLQKLCSIHWFVLLVVENIERNEQQEDVLLECFVYDSSRPSTSMYKEFMKNMYKI